MNVRTLTVLVSALSLAACSGGAVVPQTGTSGVAPAASSVGSQASAVRLPAAVLASATQRHAQDLGTSPYPLSALAWPLSALAWPLSALAWPGQAPAPAVACGGDPQLQQSNARTTMGQVGNTTGPKGAACKAQVDTGIPINPDPKAAPSQIAGVQPGLLKYIYNLPATGGAGQTVAIVVAYDNPKAEADLGVYRKAFGLPPCTTGNGCFHKIAGSGTTLPVADSGWSVESSLDLDAVSAACAQCKLELVEAASSQIPDLANAVDTAVTNGATVVSNSYGATEAADNVQYDSHYNHPGVPMTAAAGDIGYGVQFPASSQHVTAVGGTSAQRFGDAGIQEIVWPQTGAGCSSFIAKPAWQHDTGCMGRTVNDLAMLADPADGLAVYDSTLPGTKNGGWSVIGGTSLGAPVVAALFALGSSGNRMGSNAGIYAARTAATPELINVTSGSNGACTTAYLCNGATGYNGPSGNGVPWGVGAFAPIS